MSAIKKRLHDGFARQKGLTMNEYLILALVCSVFVSVFLLSALILLLPIYFIITKQIEKALPKKKHEYAFLTFSILALLTTLIYSENAVVGDQVIRSVWLKLLGIGIIILVFDIFFFINIMTKRAFELGLVLSSVLSIISFIVAVVQKIFEIYPDPINRPGRVASIFFNENYYSTVIEFVVIITLYLFFKSENKKAKLFYGFVIAINIIGLYLSQCRTAYIAVVVSIIVFLLIHSNKKQIFGILFGILIISLIIILCSGSANIGISERFRIDTLVKDLDFRVGIWKTAFESIKEHLFLGRGYYSYGAVMNEVSSGTEFTAIHAHNLFIEVLMDFGMIGTALVLAFFAFTVKSCIKRCLNSKRKTSLALIISSVLSIIIHGMLDITIIFPQTGFFAVFLLTIPQMFDEKE